MPCLREVCCSSCGGGRTWRRQAEFGKCDVERALGEFFDGARIRERRCLNGLRFFRRTSIGNCVSF